MKGCGGDCESMPRANKVLTVEKPGTAVDDNGQRVDSDSNWVQVGQVAGRFVTRNNTSSSIRNRESRVMDQMISTVTALLITTWTPKWEKLRSILPTCRMRMGDRIFNIHSAGSQNENGRIGQWELEERVQES